MTPNGGWVIAQTGKRSEVMLRTGTSFDAQALEAHAMQTQTHTHTHKHLSTPATRHALTLLTALLAIAVLTLTACGNKPAATAPDVPVAATGATTAPPIPAQTGSAVDAANIDDVTVTANVTTALLQDELLKPYSISVVTTKGDVRLTGVVTTQAQVDQAIAVARSVAGTHAIHDELTLRK